MIAFVAAGMMELGVATLGGAGAKQSVWHKRQFKIRGKSQGILEIELLGVPGRRRLTIW